MPLDAYDVLQRLKKWLRAEADHLPEYDHVVAFTRYRPVANFFLRGGLTSLRGGLNLKFSAFGRKT